LPSPSKVVDVETISETFDGSRAAWNNSGQLDLMTVVELFRLPTQLVSKKFQQCEHDYEMDFASQLCLENSSTVEELSSTIITFILMLQCFRHTIMPLHPCYIGPFPPLLDKLDGKSLCSC
jgi:hypothetical protein